MARALEGSRFRLCQFDRVLSKANVVPALECDQQAAPGNVSRLEFSLWCRLVYRFNHAAADIRERSREPPAKQRLGNSRVVCAIRSGYGQRSKAAPLQVSQLPTLRFKFRLPTTRIATQLESEKRQKSGNADNSPNVHLRPSPSNNQNVPKVSSISPAPSLMNTSGNRRK